MKSHRRLLEPNKTIPEIKLVLPTLVDKVISNPDPQDPVVCPEPLDQLDHLDIKELVVKLESPDPLALQVNVDSPDLLDPKDLMERRVCPVMLVQWDQLEHLESQVAQVSQECQDQRDTEVLVDVLDQTVPVADKERREVLEALDQSVPQETKDPVETPETEVVMVLPVYRELVERMVPQVAQALLVPQDPQEILDSLDLKDKRVMLESLV